MAYESYDIQLSITPSNLKDANRELLSATIEDKFENASDVFLIKKKDRITGVWSDVIARLTVPYKISQITSIRDDYRTLLFKDLNMPIF
jgi:hypothetical protein